VLVPEVERTTQQLESSNEKYADIFDRMYAARAGGRGGAATPGVHLCRVFAVAVLE
jgi:hypothetical protein